MLAEGEVVDLNTVEIISENDDFARACEQAGITLIGPSASSMEMMGSKTRAREVAVAAGVPVVPGTNTYLDELW